MSIRMFLLIVLLIVMAIFVQQMSQTRTHVQYGVSFNKEHARWLGPDWRETYTAIVSDLQPKYIRLSAPWNEIEPSRGQFKFGDLDWQIDEAAKIGANITLVVGQKIPRWPECHMPEWVGALSPAERKDALLAYVRAVVERYRERPNIEYWQVENEPFIRFSFGECEYFDSAYTHDEISLVRALDPGRKIVVTDSGELGTWYRASRAGDFLGITLYRVVRRPSGAVFSYDWLPALHYRLKSILLGRGVDRLIVSELQAEPWYGGDAVPHTATRDEYEKTFSPERFEKTLAYVERVGTHRAYLWGVEWWYWAKAVNSDTRYWDIAKKALRR